MTFIFKIGVLYKNHMLTQRKNLLPETFFVHLPGFEAYSFSIGVISYFKRLVRYMTPFQILDESQAPVYHKVELAFSDTQKPP